MFGGLRDYLVVGLIVFLLGWILDFLVQWYEIIPGHNLLWPIEAFQRHPLFGIALITLAVGYAILFILLLKGRRVLNEQADALEALKVYEALCSRVGLTGWWPHSLNDEHGAPWQELIQEMQRNHHSVYIVGANGINTFGGAQSPLHDVLSGFQGFIRVILSHPDNPALPGRALSVGVPVDDYVGAIRTSESRLRDLRQNGHIVDGRFCMADPPNWKMTITTTTIWVQYYQSGGQRVENTPVFQFSITNPAGIKFYNLLLMEFERMWELCKGHPMNLMPIEPRRGRAGRRRDE